MVVATRRRPTLGLTCVPAILASIVFSFVLLAPAAASADDGWSSGFDVPGVDGIIRAITVYDGALIIGGDFLHAGNVQAPYIARWDGSEWSSMNAAMDGPVRSLLVHDGVLIAGGLFDVAGGMQVHDIAQWDGTSWSDVGGGFNGGVYSLAEYNGDLIAGGTMSVSWQGFTPMNSIARWDGQSWHALGSGAGGVLVPAVLSLTTYNQSLVAGGIFTTMGGVQSSAIATWNGTAWDAMGGGMTVTTRFRTAQVAALAVYGSTLIAGGTFNQAGSVGATNIASWDGKAWSPMGYLAYNQDDPAVTALAIYNGTPIATGGFECADSCGTHYVAQWDGQGWRSVGTGIPYRYSGPHHLANALGIYNGRLIVGGDFPQAGTALVHDIASWDGTTWRSIGPGYGLNGVVNALADFNGAIVAGGSFSLAGQLAVNNIAEWTGMGWLPLGDGTSDGVDALALYDGSLIAGGRFTSAGGASANYIARWDGSSWSALGDGLDGPVRALAIYNGSLIVGGLFTHAGGVAATGLAQWDGTRWTALGDGVNSYVYSLGVYHGDLIVGGDFSLAGGVHVTSIARWNSGAWDTVGTLAPPPLAENPHVQVLALTTFNDRLFAGGNFISASGHQCLSIGQWDGVTWTDVGGGLSYYPNGGYSAVYSFLLYHNKLVVGGSFTAAGQDNTIRGIARWDGTSWLGFGTGLSAGAVAVASHDDSLFAGGAFTTAGGTASYSFASWGEADGTPAILPPLPDGPIVTLRLAPAEPNPFTSSTVIRYALPRASHLTLRIYDVRGVLVRTLLDSRQEAGPHEVRWTGRNDSGRLVPGGTYVARLEANGRTAAHTIVHLP